MSPDSLNNEFNPLVIYIGNTGIIGMVKVYTGDDPAVEVWDKQVGGVQTSQNVILLC